MVAGLAFAICCLGWAALAGPMGKWTFLLSVGFFLLWVFVEAFMLSEMGTTIGKAVLGVTVRNEEGNDLTYGQALARGFRVLYRGCGLVLFGPVAMIVSYFRLTGNGSTSWDRDGRLTVSHSRVGFVRGITAFVCIIGLYGMTIFASSIAASATDPGAPIVAAAATAPAVPVATIPSITMPPAAAPPVALPPPPPPPIQISSPKPNRRTPAKRKAPAAVAPKGNTAGAPAKTPTRGPAPLSAARTRGAERTETASAAPTARSVDQDPNSSSDGKIMIIRRTR
jgi:hypothetical protein